MSRVQGGGGPGSSAAVRPAQTAQVKTQGRAASNAQLAPAPAARVVPKNVAKQEKVRAGYMFDKERLNKTIAAQTEEISAAIDDAGLDPQDVTFGYVIDLTGEDKIVCVACGRENHDYMPTKYRGPNPEIDMMADSITVFQESVSKTGANYFILLYDDKRVTVLREPQGPVNDAERADIIQRFRAMRDAQGNVDATPDWMSQMSRRWTPDMAVRTFVDAPQDDQACDLAVQLFSHLDTEIRGLFWAKSLAKGDMRKVDERLKSNRVIATGMAMGTRADAVAPMMFPARTIKARDMHDTADLVGTGLAKIIDALE